MPFRARRHPVRWITGALILAFLYYVGKAFTSADAIDFSIIPNYLFSEKILEGLYVTLFLMAVALILGVAIGLLLAVARLSDNPIARWVSLGYVWFFLGTPGLVQLIFWYNLAIVVPSVSLGIPDVITLWSGSTNEILTPLTAAMIGLGLHEAAYFCEVIRSGIMSVNKGQVEAAGSLGMRKRVIMQKIVLPQAFRVMLPPGMTRVIALMKDTSLVAVIAGGELMTNAQAIYTANYRVLELLIVVCIWYLTLVSLLLVMQRFVEKWASRYQTGGTTRPAKTPLTGEIDA